MGLSKLGVLWGRDPDRVKSEFLEKLSLILLKSFELELTLSNLLDLTAHYTRSSIGSVNVFNIHTGYPEVVIGHPKILWSNDVQNAVITQMKAGQGIVKLVSREGRIIIRDISRSTYQSQYIPISGSQSKWLLALPMKFERNLIGILHLEGNDSLRETDIEIAEIAAAHGSIALKNILMQLQQQKNHEKTLEIISAKDTNEICTQICDYIRQIVDTKYISIWLRDDVFETQKHEIQMKSVLVILFTDGYPKKNVEVTLDYDKHIIGAIIKSRQPKFILDVMKEKKYQPKRIAKALDLKSLFILPLFSAAKDPIGAVNIYPVQNAIFNEQHMETMRTLIGPFSMALEIAQLREVENQVRALAKIPRFLLQQPIDDFLENLIKSIQKGIKVEACSLFLLDSKKDAFILRATTGVKNGNIGEAYYKSGEGITGGVAETGETFRTHNMDALRKSKGKFQEILQSEPAKAFIAIPLLSADKKEGDGKPKVIGILRFVNKLTDNGNESFFSIRDQELLEHFANVITNIIENAEWAAEYKRLSEIKDHLLIGLEHELIQPIDGIVEHTEFFKEELGERFRDEDSTRRINLKTDDVLNHCLLLEMLVRGIRTLDEEMKLNLGKVNFYTDILLPCKHFVLTKADERDLFIEIGYSAEWNLWLSGDKLKLLLVFYNLLLNAIKYSNKGSKEKKGIIKIYLSDEREKGGEIYIDIENIGIGVPLGEENKIFEQYYRGSNVDLDIEGEGLGLYKCMLTLEKHGCKISVYKHHDPTIFRIKINPDIIL